MRAARQIKVLGSRGKIPLKPIIVTGKFFCVTPYAGDRNNPVVDESRFAVTHIPTGLALIPEVGELNRARLLALEIEKIAMPWESKDADAIRQAFKTLSLEDKKLVLSLQSGELP